ncbi:hypothetical protein [Halanaerobacter jeridensis]|uniref:Uncharacterized protein n=1 Tax=Halanaerobacter jeridensis TaxID=706427 RepID=A0A938XUL0_9FIRM|nr:hypothetical protein [Halanaerobacter jeridensis]MBM7555857.1 hypothetical protein [Halanaerobacter jeridensis]
MEDINLKKVIVAAIIALILLFSGNYLITDYRVDRQLEKQLTELPQIKEVKVEEEKEYQLEIFLVDIEDLRTVNLEVRKKISDILNTDNYSLIFRGKESINLKQIYNKINLALYESLVTGKYTKFGSEVDKYREQYNLQKAEVKVDHDYIYLTLADDKGAIYKVLTRSKSKVGDENG